MTFEILQVNGRNGVVTGREDGTKVQYAFEVRDSNRSNVRLQESRLQDVLVLYGALLDRTILCHPALKQSAVSLEFLTRDKNAAAIALRRALNKRGITTLSVADKFEAVFPADQARAAKSAIVAFQSATGPQSNQPIPSGMLQLRGLDLPQALDLYGELVGRNLIQGDRLAGSPIFLISQTRLSRAEVVFAFDVLFSWQRLKVVFVGENAFRVVPMYSP